MNKFLFSIKQPYYGPLAAIYSSKCDIKVEFTQEETYLQWSQSRLTGPAMMRAFVGSDPLTATQIDYWIDFTQDHLYGGDFKALSHSFDVLNNHLTLSSFLVGYSLTSADLAVWGALKGLSI